LTDKNLSYEQARELLRKHENNNDGTDTKQSTEREDAVENDDDDEDDDEMDDKPYLWGGLSVGPVWKSRLLKAAYNKPTPIQIESYRILSQSKKNKNNQPVSTNAILAAPTGSGKSLAYLLPLLTTLNVGSGSTTTTDSNNNNMLSKASLGLIGKVWIMTPTMELACQLQRVVMEVMQTTKENVEDDGESITDSSNNNSIFHVLQSPDDYDEEYPFLTQIISSCHTTPTVFIAGTPKLLLQLRKEIKNVLASSKRQYRNNPNNNSNVENNDGGENMLRLRSVAKALDANLQTVVLDEADRLLRTTISLSTTKDKEEAKSTFNERQPKMTIPAAQQLLQSLVYESSFRRQTQPFVKQSRRPSSPPPNASSMSSSLQIICASATVGRSLRRQIMDIVGAPSMDKAATLITADVRTKKNAENRKSSLLPTNLQHAYKIIINDGHLDGNEDDSSDSKSMTILRELDDTMQQLDPHPCLIFPGPVGVEATQLYLQNERLFQDIRGLSSLRERTTPTDDSDCRDWKTMPIYVVKERLGRGLDLTEVKYVFLLGIPTNAASYAHLAGRTARGDQVGTAITIFNPSDAIKLSSIAETLGLTLSCLNDDK
jgi:superfamily II DNA/RNA helicase